MFIDISSKLITGLAVFLYGIYVLSTASKNLSLSKIKKIIEKGTSSVFKSYLIGTGITMLIQSSSVTSVILIGFLNIGVMQLERAIAVMFGANIGTTITAQLISFKLTKFTPLFLLIGIILFFAAKKERHKNYGLIVFSFGLIFFGLSYMSHAVKPLSKSEEALTFFTRFSEHPLLAILAGIVVTIFFQSSSTTIGMVIALASAGIIDFRASFFIVLGDNIGTCITAVLASIHGCANARRLAAAHTLFNIFGTAIAYLMAPLYLSIVPRFSTDISRQIANAHSLFNVFTSLLFIAFIPLFVKLLNRIIQGEEYKQRETRYLDENLLDKPSFALTAVTKEFVLMLEVCADMMKKSMTLVDKYDAKLFSEIQVDEESVDEIQKNCTKYIIEITQHPLTDKQMVLIPNFLHTVNDIEKIGDFSLHFARQTKEIYENSFSLSPDAQREIKELLKIGVSVSESLCSAINDNNKTLARAQIAEIEQFKEKFEVFRNNHVERASKKLCDSRAIFVFNNMLYATNSIIRKMKNIALALVHIGKR